jgi:phage terminase large subunit-like protein
MTTKKKQKRANISNDKAEQYALDVTAKKPKVVAGLHVRNACLRHLNDLKTAKERGLKYDETAAKKAVDYFYDVLRLAGGEFEGLPFKLKGWQIFVVSNLFGWKIAATGLRRFGTAYVETGKGSGKTPLAAGIGLKMLTSDKEPRAEVYAVATKRDQAMILFRDAISMYQQSPELYERLKATGAKGREWNLYFPAEASFFRPIGSESTGQGQSGVRPHCNLIDEIHEHPTNAMIEFMSAGKKSRRQALDFMITNSGHDRQSVCYEYHEYACKVCDPADDMEDDSFFGYVCSLDKDDDPFKDESCWIKVNPSLPDTPTYDYLRRQVAGAKGMPSKESIVRRLNFCEWVDADNPWVSRDSWNKCVKDMEMPDGECVAAIDLSKTTDLSALTLVFDGEKKKAFSYFWTPADTVRERENRDRSPYSQWIREGHLIGVAGKSLDYAFIAKQIRDINEKNPIRILAFDRWRIVDLIKELDLIGVECYEATIEMVDEREKIVPKDNYGSGIALLSHGQGFKDMGAAVAVLEKDVLNETIEIQNNPVMTMCASNAVLETDAAENRKFTKRKSTGRIDGMISLSMANRVCKYINAVDDGTIYDTENLLVV